MMTSIVTPVSANAPLPAGCVLLGVVNGVTYWHVGPDADAASLKDTVSVYAPAKGAAFHWDDFASASAIADQLMPHVFAGLDEAPAEDTPFVMAMVQAVQAAAALATSVSPIIPTPPTLAPLDKVSNG